ASVFFVRGRMGDDNASRDRIRPIRNRYFFVADLLLIVAAAVVSFWLRLDVAGIRSYRETLLVFVTLTLALKPLVFVMFGLYRRFWRYASARELLTIALATLSGSAVVTLALYSLASLFVDFRPVPRSIPIIDWLVSTPLVGGTRFAVRLIARHEFPVRLGNSRRHPLKQESDDTKRVLVMGAGDAGAMIVREMQANPGLGLDPVGLLDDDRAKVGMTIHGVAVRGTRETIPHLAQRERVDQVIIAMPTAPGKAIRNVVEICQEAGVAYRTIPGIYELISGRVSVRQVREVVIDDLLRRDPVRLERDPASRYLRGARVLVTGAGGSIGAELCRQIAAQRPEALLLLGHGETSVYRILREMRESFPGLDVAPLIADVRHPTRMETLLARHEPEVIFHAAAHKHVPLMERNVCEAVTNNVEGTRLLLEGAVVHGVERFILISTDKAVNPVNVMGATKRVAELLVQDVALRTGRPYAAVRFGNVLGSRGSVVPLFQRQIAAGGPITVTHPEMERYFMTIPEAVQLVIRAGALAEGGEVFVLDMGEQVRIVELAKELVRLSGLEPGRDIEIVFTQPRPGEKLSEELFGEDEEPRRTGHEKIFMAYGNNWWSSEALAAHVRQLEALAQEGDRGQVEAKLCEIVPGYLPVGRT
ncbi:MAG: nucleoside-diphosphate sugar epimerase/dehydratase, partial [Chloroflexota bacterium]|nr:nucleoside-diphosphate sugar epimerase/dehydratase [Chloroflexota bacterium]